MTRPAQTTPTGLFLVVGDVHGHWSVVAEHAAAARARHGRLDGIFCVGDVQAMRNEAEVEGMHCPSKYRTIGEFPEVVGGAIRLGAPTWFIGGNHEPWPALDAHGPGEWIPGVTFLGRAGAADVAGLRVAFLSGIHSERVSPLKASDRRSTKERCYWVDSEVEDTRRAGSKQPVDLLITHEWPSGVGEDVRGLPCGSEDLELLARELRPTLYVVGHMHVRRSARLGPTRVEALSHILGGPDASLVAEWTADRIVIHEPLQVPIRDWRYAAALA